MQEVKTQLPPDIIQDGPRKMNSCLLGLTVTFHSTLLAKAVGTDDPDGAISVTLTALGGGVAPYNSSQVGDATISPDIVPQVSC